MIYDRFTYAERRERLLRERNKLRYMEFSLKQDPTAQSAIPDLCQTASTLQLQFGISYQRQQHLRNMLVSMCRLEPWAHRLTAMQTGDGTSVKEFLVRTITDEKVLEKSKNNTFLQQLSSM